MVSDISVVFANLRLVGLGLCSLPVHPIQEHLYTGVVGPSIRVVVGLSYRTTAYFAISDAGGSYDAKMAIKQQ